MSPSNNMKSVLILANHKLLKGIILPNLNVERDKIDWNNLNYHAQSGGVQALLSWVYCLFCDEVPPKEWGYRDPFESFFSLDRDIQVLILQALSVRHGFLELSLKDKPKSAIELMLEQMSKNLEKGEN